MRPGRLWVGAVLITIVSALWQRWTGPTYPLRLTVAVGGTSARLRLLRTHEGSGDQPVRLLVADTAVTGEIAWRRYPTADPWVRVPLVRAGDTLVASLPHQLPAGKLAYQVTLRRSGPSTTFPQTPVVTRFKSYVPRYVLVPHILMMVLALLFTSRAGLLAWAREPGARRTAYAAAGILALGGFVLGPMALHYAFGPWWEGIPIGWDLTDNKTLIAGLAWLWALWRMRGGRETRGAIITAAVVTLVTFAIPHSLFGSQIDWGR
jgi:hypothetical protein